MILEYSNYDRAYIDSQFRDIIKTAISYDPDVISVLPTHLRTVKNILGNTTIKLSCPIDFPLGILDLTDKKSALKSAIKKGAKIVEVVCPSHVLCNRKYDRLRDEVKIMQEIASDEDVEIRYILEYRFFSYDLMYKVANILLSANIHTIYPSTGYFIDDIHDNILASALMNKKVPDINIICNGNFWSKNHINLVKKSNLYGFRVNSINGLDLMHKNILNCS